MNSKIQRLTRRRVLRGMLAGGAVTVGLPILDCMLNENGTAFADTGAPMPTRFVTWSWGLGLGEQDWRPKTAGKDYELPWQMAALKPFQPRLNLFSGSEVQLDGAANQTHFTGVQGFMTGKVSSSGDYFNSADGVIADAIGARSRFRTLVFTCDGDPKASWTAFASGKVPAEVSPVNLYKRIFGPTFADPNAANFTPDPETMVLKSVLSGVSDQRASLNKVLGTADRQKLDYYYTAVRSMEQKLDIELQKPAPLPSCNRPNAVEDDGHALFLATDAMTRHELFTDLIVHALACDQTRVANANVSFCQSALRKEGDPTGHHSWTHEEPVDPAVGYQVKCSWFQQTYFKELYTLASKLDAVKEGDKSLLDHLILFAYTDHGAPRLHSVRNYPFITIGSGNGRIKTGMHFATPGGLATRVTYTMQQAMGVQAASWGTGSNRVTSPISGVLA